MPLKYDLPYLPLTNSGYKRRNWAYLIPVVDGQPPEKGLPRMRDVFNNFSVVRDGESLRIHGPFTEGYYMFWVYGDVGAYDVKKHFFSDHVVTMAHPRHAEFSTGAWRDPGPVQGPVFFNFYGKDCRPPYIRVSGEGVSGGDNLLTWDLREMRQGRFNGEFLFRIMRPNVTEVILDGTEMRGLTADVITLEPIDLEERHRVKVQPLPERGTQHPRLYFDEKTLQQIRESRHKNANAPIYKKLLALMNQAAATRENKEGGLWHPEGRERIFETDRLVLCAFGWLMEREEHFLKAAVESLEQIAAPDYAWPGVDNQVAMVMGALTAGYDWLYNDIPEELRHRVEDVMAEKAEEGYRMKLLDRYYRQNHFMTTVFFSVGAAAFVLWDKRPEEAARWGAFARTSLERTLALCPDDGSWMTLWYYELLSLVPFVEMLRQMTGENIFQREPYFRNAGAWWLYQRTGDWRWHEGWNPAHRNTQNECPWIYRWAGEFQNPVLQWAADGIRPIVLDRTDWRFAQPQRRVFEYLWRDPELVPEPPKKSDRARHFSDNGQTFIRSGWEPDALVFEMRCGPLLGHTAFTQGELGSYGHSRPDMNVIRLYAHGVDLLSRYIESFGNTTHTCSTVLVDGCGQLGPDSFYGEGGTPLPGQTGYARHFRTTPDFDYVEGVASACYPPELKVRNFTRRILHLPPGLFVIVDELAADEPRLFQWRLVSSGNFRSESERGRFTLERDPAVLDILVASPPLWTQVIGEEPLLQGYCSGLDERQNFLGIDAPHTAFETTFMTLLSPRRISDPVTEFSAIVSKREDGLGVDIRCNGNAWSVIYTKEEETSRRVIVTKE